MVYSHWSAVKVFTADSGMVMSALTANMGDRGYAGHIDGDDLPPYDKMFVRCDGPLLNEPRKNLEKALEDWGRLQEDTKEC